MITIFTPTYNRAEQLKRVYESLTNQTCFDFEWLIVDDGSNDATQNVVMSFEASLFKIRYYKKKNGGKHTAYNYALDRAEGDYFFCLDSDDWLAPDAVKILLEELPKCETPFVLCYKIDEKQKMLSDSFPKDLQKVRLFDLKNRYNCGGEFSIVFETEFARRYPFPIFEGERFLTEAVIYDQMAMDTDVWLLPQIITICEYQTDGLSNNLNKVMKNNPAGYCMYFMQRIDVTDNLKERVINVGKYHCFRTFSKEKACPYTGRHRGLVLLTKPLGILFFLYYKMVRGF